MQNLSLFRTRAFGVNWGGTPTQPPTSIEPGYFVKLLINTAYNEFLTATKDFPIAALKVSFLTTLNTASYPMNPIPAAAAPLPVIVNPSALNVYEMTYTQAGNVERYIPLSGTDRFRRIAGGYVRRFGNNSVLPQSASFLFGRRQLDIVPGTANVGDTISLTVCPDPQSSPSGCPATNGGILVADSDVPLIPPQFHMALVEYAVMKLCDGLERPGQIKDCQAEWQRYISDAQMFGSAFGEGDAEQHVYDPFDIYDEVLGPSPQ